jgi:formamidopyrimidine-DNA glycosylase
VFVPELPDVEGFRRVLAEHATGRPVQRVDVLDEGVLRGVTPRRFRERLRGCRFAEPRRHGKWLIVPTDGRPVLLAHFGMTGSLHWVPDGGEARHPHDRVVFVLPDGELRYRDMRKLQGLRLAADDEVEEALGGLGPDASTVSRAQLRDLLAGVRRQVKPALVDQSVLAGLGNLLADEILWRARIHPRRSCADLTPDDLARLHTAMREVLRRSVPTGRVPPRGSWLTGHRDERPGACPRCGTTLCHGRVGGRGTAWCPRCQPE